MLDGGPLRARAASARHAARRSRTCPRAATATRSTRSAQAFDARLLDVHPDPDHHRSVFTLAGEPGSLARRVAERAPPKRSRRVDVNRHDGHPPAGRRDRRRADRLSRPGGSAARRARRRWCSRDLLGSELELPVFLYGELAAGRTRAELRRGGPGALAARIESGELRPDFGPRRLHPTAGAVLVAARPPLVAFNVELAPPATLEDARSIAALIREGGPEGLESVRAIGLWLDARGRGAGVDQRRGPPARRSARAAGRRGDALAAAAPTVPADAELVGLAPAARRSTGFRPTTLPDSAESPGYDRGRARRRRRARCATGSAPARTKLHSTMAQTKRKRRTKHRGTAAGTIQTRGRTGRPPTAEERKKQDRSEARERRLNTPPTWKAIGHARARSPRC